ncbi:zf-HC2 domain-containing protein [Engelhardtia mirabilis]|uniref:Putative zinc-finger domain-containing protein n=1 Tax=Engelhardtia mirabilis TaxID=2528011 RepID=A0A518BQG2_9BACT|nr:hypothetical protein Pla133_43320 [Planctomycetes bacterium Pla133]QDV03542.1 hypothetical protein Pla86_43310 [Planctomycetes bacterium Pla86]
MKPIRSTPESWASDGEDPCADLQLQLSMLADGELDEVVAARAVAQLETCPECREFFDGIRAQVELNRALHDPERLALNYAALVGGELPRDLETRQLVHRLVSIFYQLGKAYTLAAIDPGYRTRVFERAVSVEPTRVHGRGFVDGVAHRSGGPLGGFDWRDKRRLLNGALESIEEPLEKGRRLLDEALAIEPDFEHALLYLAFIDLHEKKVLKAAKRFREVFETAIDPGSRGHAAVQLGKLHTDEGEYRDALLWFRWIGISGLADLDSRFFFVRFNIGLCHAHLRRADRAIEAFRGMLDRYPDRVGELVGFFARSKELQRVIDSQPGFTDELVARCPELFQPVGEVADETH